MSTGRSDSSPAFAVFEAYGTIFDCGSAVGRRGEVIGDSVTTLIDTWRTKQLQYTWLRTIQHQYVNFAQVTAEALDYALDAVGIRDDAFCQDLLSLYTTLDAYPDAVHALHELHRAGVPCWILSNGTPAMLTAAVRAAGLTPLIGGVLSVESLGVYKPDARVYQLAADTLDVEAGRIAFVSANGWDAFAAAHFGLSAVWCNRIGQPTERLPGIPAYEVTSLDALPAVLGIHGVGLSPT